MKGIQRSEINVKELLLHALNGTTFPPQQQTTNTCKGRPKSKTIAEGTLPKIIVESACGHMNVGTK